MNTREEIRATQREVAKAMLVERAAKNRTRLGDIALARIRMIGYCNAKFESRSISDSEGIRQFVETHDEVILEWHDPIWRTPDLAPMIVEVHLR